MKRRIVGPFWSYPVLNAILEFFERLRERRRARLSTAGPSATYSNVEEYSIWEDPSGVIKVRVVRKAKRGNK